MRSVTVPVNAITVLLKTALPFRRNGTSFECPFNLREVVKKMPNRLQRILRSTAVVRFQNWHVSMTGTVSTA